MKAVNLIPENERRGAGGTAGRTGGAAYVLVGGLALIVIMLAAYAMTSKSIHDKQAELAKVEQQAAASEAKAGRLTPYTAFATLRQNRVATVRSIADSRFDWAHAMHELGRTLPRNITLTTLTGSVSTAGAGGSGGVGLRAAYDVPAIELTGCAPGQAAIPPMLTSLRQVDGVRRVALQQSIKGGDGEAATPTTAGTTGTAGKTVRAPACARTFQAVIFYDPKPTPTAVGAATTDPAAAAAATTPVSGGTK
ncbi:MAG: hypothetical protein JWM31_2556 [Solirubrobacterales bacterium]|nr:hypothetical protein [Solirubrobacterales bacterium]